MLDHLALGALAEAIPGFGETPEGQLLRSEALFNQALPYEERVGLLQESQRLNAEDPKHLSAWRMGQGAAAGAGATLLALKATDALSKIVEVAQARRIEDRISDLSRGLDEAERRSPGFRRAVLGRVTDLTGLPVKTTDPRAWVRGPLQAVEGSTGRALAALGDLFYTEGGKRGLRFTGPQAVPKLYQAWRASAHPEWSIADTLLRKADRGVRSLTQAAHSPAGSIALGLSGIGLGAILGKLIGEAEASDEQVMSSEDALEFIRAQDRSRAQGISSRPKILGEVVEATNAAKSAKDAALPLGSSLANAGDFIDRMTADEFARNPLLATRLVGM